MFRNWWGSGNNQSEGASTNRTSRKQPLGLRSDSTMTVGPLLISAVDARTTSFRKGQGTDHD